MKAKNYILIVILLLAGFLRFYRPVGSFSFLAALLGTLTVLLFYFLTKELFRKSITNYQLPITNYLLLALSPWHLHLSRYSLVASLTVFLVTLSAFVFQKFFSQKRWLFLPCLLVFTWFFCLQGSLFTCLPIRELSRNYLSHFTPSFFFISKLTGETPSVAEAGLMYLTELPFLLMGLYSMLAKKIKNRQFLIAWFLLVPILACFYPKTPALIRVVGFLPVLPIFTSIGLISLWQGTKRKKSKKLLFTVYCLLFVFNIVHFLHYYFIHLPKEGSQFWFTLR